ncbi:hypothetical protein EGJ28_21345 [Stutzerimonas xanthomarina]|uniref:Uncharacterized protein n=1 Tax=Stutzerimonas xanthomarina TaxID=271420 RepID=A0A3R9ALJ6_9GAMM|nr:MULTISPECIES: hypothetical protein [Stutzerimonas]KIL03112.1 hypothetical protein QX25_18110 [Stutzerimonas stutzeri]RRV05486.1 hypothetical protein EGJ28_21345 [Stutzerimonas xanthomarina]
MGANVTFSQEFPLPPGFPVTGWRTSDACGHSGSFHIARDGVITLVHDGLDVRFVSADASGVFRLNSAGDAELQWPDIYVHFHNGKAVQAKLEPSSGVGFRFEPTWRLDAPDVPAAALNVDSLISIIRSARVHRTQRFQDETIRVMVALALCDGELLKPVSPVNAWRMLSPEQLIAVTTWSR